ncbi:MAG TPA: hypothetical protein VGK24_09535, partial [Candidatus Angelobacter sp.]
MKKTTFANKCLIHSLLLCFVLVSIVPMTGCSATVVVQGAVNSFQVAQGFVGTAKALVPELQTINPELAAEVREYADFASANLTNLITAGNAYLAAPSGDKYQNI